MLWNLHFHLPKVWIVIIVDAICLNLVVVIVVYSSSVFIVEFYLLMVSIDIIPITAMLLVTSLLILFITFGAILFRLIIIRCRIGHNWMLCPITRMEMTGFLHIHLLLLYYILRFSLIILTKIHQPLNKLPYLIFILLCIYPTIVFYLVIPHT